jgi:hypothetical protein
VHHDCEEKRSALALKAFAVLGTRSMEQPRCWILAAALAVLGAIPGCASKEEGIQAAPAPLAKLVGRVATVDVAGHYALIQVYGTWSVPDEDLLRVQSDVNGASTLRPTGERQGRYVAADIVSGSPGTGDAVMYLPASASAPAPASSELRNPAAAPESVAAESVAPEGEAPPN